MANEGEILIVGKIQIAIGMTAMIAVTQPRRFLRTDVIFNYWNDFSEAMLLFDKVLSRKSGQKSDSE